MNLHEYCKYLKIDFTSLDTIIKNTLRNSNKSIAEVLDFSYTERRMTIMCHAYHIHIYSKDIKAKYRKEKLKSLI
jgi:hypothetical protein